MRTIPWVREALARYGSRGLTAVGIHTPEFEHEKVAASVAEHVREHRLEYPHLLDNDQKYWRALDNEYWPALYLVDRCGYLRAHTVGEVHANESTGRDLEKKIEALLAESPPDCGTRRSR